MFTVSSLGLMIRISPPDARGRVAGLFSSGVPDRLGRRAGAGQPDRRARAGGAVRDLRRRAAASRRRGVLQPAGIRRWRRPRRTPSPPCRCGGACATGRTGPRCSPTSRRVGRRSGLRIALVPLFVVEVLGRGAGVAGLALATFAIGNVSVVIPSGYLSDRIGRRKLLIVGLTVSAVATMPGRVHVVAAGVPGGGVRDRRGDGHLHLAAAGRGRRHRRQQGARRNRRRDVPDDGRPRLDRRVAGGRPDRPAPRRSAGPSWSAARILLLAAIGWVFAPGDPARPPPGTRRPARSARRPAAKCPDLRF